jgi:hypothetical protein
VTARRAILTLGVAALLVAGAGQSATPPASGKGMWITPAELKSLPRRGNAWQSVRAAARGDLGEADIGNQDSQHDVRTLAAALVYGRTGWERYREKAAREIVEAIGTQQGGSVLALARNLVAYVVAADLVDLRAYDRADDARFRRWLRRVRHEPLGSAPYSTLVATHERSANNWGTHAGASRIAVALYLGDRTDLVRAARVFRGWLGDRAAYAGFAFTRDRSWQSESRRPIGVNPPQATKDGRSIDGALPEEMRRGGKFSWPPRRTGYPWEALQGAVVQAELLHRRGLHAWRWQADALRRAVAFLHGLSLELPEDGWWASGDDAWIPWLVNARYGTRFPASPQGLPGKNMGWTQWTHAQAAARGEAGPSIPAR